MLKMQRIISFAFVTIFSAGLSACDGDNSSEAKDPKPVEPGSNIIVETFDSLPVCNDNREGTMAYVREKWKAYICENENWVNALRSDYSSSSYNDSEESSDYKSEEESSSSEADDEEQSSSSVHKNSSSNLDIPDGWSWDVPKEARLNPKIAYGTMTDTRDNKKYKTVKIGNLTWMAENLNYYKASDPSVSTNSWCYDKSDNEDSATCDVAGRLYTWAAAIDSARLYTDMSIDCSYNKTCSLPDTVYGICPPGWHLPNKIEWEALFTAVGGRLTAAPALKSQTGWGENCNGTNASGFSAFPSGYKDYNGIFHIIIDKYIAFWSSTENDNAFVNVMRLDDYAPRAFLSEDSKLMGYPIRCVQNSK